MRYLLLICTDPTGEPYTPEGDTIEQWLAETGPARIDGDRLRPVSDARTVRVRGSQTLVTDGPFAETAEHIAGYDVIECASDDEAVRIAAKRSKDDVVVVCFSGRGDKDCAEVARLTAK